MASPPRQTIALAIAAIGVAAVFVYAALDRPSDEIIVPAAAGRPAVPAAAGPTSSDPTASDPTESGAVPAAPETTDPAPPTTEARGPLGSGEPVTIAFGGDAHFEGHLRSKLDADPNGVLEPLAPLFEGADLTVVNFESAITEGGSPANKAYTFRAPATALDALAAGGIDVVSMANNHGMDFGVEGLDDSLAARDASGYPVIGIGDDADEAYAPYLTTIKGQRIAVIAATQVLDDHLISAWTATDNSPGLASAKEEDRLLAAVADIRPEADTVVVFIHWGREKLECPTDIQKDIARKLVDAGADIVVGGHAHRVQGAGMMDDALVGYGLGNFVWYNEKGAGAHSGTLVVTVTGRQIDSYEWRPAMIRGGLPRALEGQERDDALANWNVLRSCTDLDE